MLNSDRDTLDKIITNKRIGWYAGIDPTGPSLHVGHMLSFMILGWAYVHGMKSVFLVRILNRLVLICFDFLADSLNL